MLFRQRALEAQKLRAVLGRIGTIYRVLNDQSLWDILVGRDGQKQHVQFFDSKGCGHTVK